MCERSFRSSFGEGSSLSEISSSFARRRESNACLTLLDKQSFRSPCGRASHLSLLVQRKVTERKHTPAARSPGILPSDFARLLRGSLTAHPCADIELGAIHRAHPCGAFPPHPRRATGAPLTRILRAKARNFVTTSPRKRRSCSALDLGPPSPRRASHAAPGKLEERSRGIAIAERQHRDVLSRGAGAAKKRRGPRAQREARCRGRLLLTPGVLPFAASRPAPLFAPLLRSSGYFLLAKQEKVTRSPEASGSPALSEKQKRCTDLRQ
jgi:hypothetical protein